MSDLKVGDFVQFKQLDPPFVPVDCSWRAETKECVENGKVGRVDWIHKSPEAEVHVKVYFPGKEYYYPPMRRVTIFYPREGLELCTDPVKEAEWWRNDIEERLWKLENPDRES